MRLVGAFTGMGGLETGLARAGMRTVAVAEIDPFASHVLGRRLPGVPNLSDVCGIEAFPDCEIVAAGFPCQDISQAGHGKGIVHGERSGLVRQVFRAISNMPARPEWLLFENVPFLLSQHGGSGVAWLVQQVESAGYRWAYRVIDSRAFGIPHRRRRLFMLASRTQSPEHVLFDGDRAAQSPIRGEDTPCGFYWTEGKTGLGWAVDAIPPMRAMSKVISPPAIWRPESADFVLPTIEDAEALQGFERGWSAAATELKGGKNARWKMVGNAVSVPASLWIGSRIVGEGERSSFRSVELLEGQRWPAAAHGGGGRRYRAEIGEWPGSEAHGTLRDFISPEAPQLSFRAARGFLGRLESSYLKPPELFREHLRAYVAQGGGAGRLAA